jgi:outer membrane protein assembly factor BamB
MPAYYNQTVYFGAVDDAIKAFSITNAMLSTAPVSQTTNVFGLTGASPAISANFTTGAILWTVDNGGNGSLLRAYDAANLTQELYNSGQASNGRDSFGAAGSFVIPVVANGRVYVATQNGVAVFGLLQ